MQMPALFSRKLGGTPVMLRVTRYEENYIGRARPGFQTWLRMGFLEDGKCNAIDLLIVQESRVRTARATSTRQAWSPT